MQLSTCTSDGCKKKREKNKNAPTNQKYVFCFYTNKHDTKREHETTSVIFFVQQVAPSAFDKSGSAPATRALPRRSAPRARRRPVRTNKPGAMSPPGNLLMGGLEGAEPAKCLTGVCLCTEYVSKEPVFFRIRLLAHMKETCDPSSRSRTPA